VKNLLLCSMSIVLLGCAHPPRLDWDPANRNRDACNPGTPAKNESPLEGTLGEQRDDLPSLAEKAKPGDTIDVKLGPGIYVLEDAVVVKGAKLIIRGPGADKTRIHLKTDDWRALTVDGCSSFEMRGVTVAGYTGGGIDVKNCPRVIVNECDFVGSRYGLELVDCGTAWVDSCVFAGCEKAITFERTHLVLRGTAISECFNSIMGRGQLEASGCVLAGNPEGAGVSLRPGSTIRSCLFGRMEPLKVTGNPKVRSSLMFDDLYDRFHVSEIDDNTVLRDIELFPDDVDPIPRGCNMGAIHYALERLHNRLVKDPGDRIRDALETEAHKYADAARKALEAKDLRAARRLQSIAMDYVRAIGAGNDALRLEIEGIVPG